jgi:hypothetical protein
VRVFVRVRGGDGASTERLTYAPDCQGVCLKLEDGVPHDFRFHRVFTPESSQVRGGGAERAPRVDSAMTEPLHRRHRRRSFTSLALRLLKPFSLDTTPRFLRTARRGVSDELRESADAALL